MADEHQTLLGTAAEPLADGRRVGAGRRTSIGSRRSLTPRTLGDDLGRLAGAGQGAGQDSVDLDVEPGQTVRDLPDALLPFGVRGRSSSDMPGVPWGTAIPWRSR